MVGRKCSITDEKLGALKMAFKCGMTMKMACCQAGVSISSYDRYVQKHPEFREEVALLRKTVECSASINIAKAIEEGDVKTSIWKLEHEERKLINKERIKTMRAQQSAVSAGLTILGEELDMAGVVRELDEQTLGSE